MEVKLRVRLRVGLGSAVRLVMSSKNSRKQ